MERNVEEEGDLDTGELAQAPPGLSDLVVDLRTPVHPTEDEDAVRRAISNIFPTLDVERAGSHMIGRGEGPRALARLRRRFREMRIRDTARSVLRSGREGDTIHLSLNKQSAYARVPNFSTGGAPLGDIEVAMKTADPPLLVEWLCQPDEA